MKQPSATGSRRDAHLAQAAAAATGSAGDGSLGRSRERGASSFSNESRTSRRAGLGAFGHEGSCPLDFPRPARGVDENQDHGDGGGRLRRMPNVQDLRWRICGRLGCSERAGPSPTRGLRSFSSRAEDHGLGQRTTRTRCGAGRSWRARHGRGMSDDSQNFGAPPGRHPARERSAAGAYDFPSSV